MSDKSNRKIEYRCSICGRLVGRNNLRSKRSVFREMGAQGSTVKSRVIAWLCVVPHDDGGDACLYRDADWNAPPLSASPGMADTRLAPLVKEEKDDEA